MKRILAVSLMVFALTIGLVISPTSMSQAQAMEYNQYWNGDTNYPLVYGHMGTAWYLDASSVVVQEDVYDGSNIHRIWAENIISVDTAGSAQSKTYWYRDYDGTMYYRDSSSDWKEFDPWSPYGFMQVVANGCKIGWRVAFGSTFS